MNYIEYLPDLKNTIQININLGIENKNKYIFYYAAESVEMQNNLVLNNASNKEKAYDNYENRGWTRLDSNGECIIWISMPISYNSSHPHFHYVLSDENRNWTKKVFAENIKIIKNSPKIKYG